MTILPNKPPATVLHMPPIGPAPEAKAGYIVVIVPVVDKPHYLFMHTLTSMFYFCGRLQLPILLVTQMGSAIPKVRNLAMNYVETEVEQKLKIKVDWILHLDSDMVIPEYLLPALLRHNKDIVGCTYVRRTKPFDCLGKTLENKMTQTGDEILHEMAGLPTGCLLVRREVFSKLKKPYFRMPWREESEIGANDQFEWGEDYTFCASARAAGYKIWLDVQLSKLVGHMSERPLYPEKDDWPDLKEAVNG